MIGKNIVVGNWDGIAKAMTVHAISDGNLICTDADGIVRVVNPHNYKVRLEVTLADDFDVRMAYFQLKAEHYANAAKVQEAESKLKAERELRIANERAIAAKLWASPLEGPVDQKRVCAEIDNLNETIRRKRDDLDYLRKKSEDLEKALKLAQADSERLLASDTRNAELLASSRAQVDYSQKRALELEAELVALRHPTHGRGAGPTGMTGDQQ